MLMSRLVAVVIILIAIVSAVPILRHTWWMPEDISTHGAPIDEQMSETMAEAGICFLASQIILALFIWKFSDRKAGDKITSFPGGARGLVIAAFLLVGTEVFALGALRCESLGRGLLHTTCGQCYAHPSASRAICVLLPLSRPGRKLRPASPGQDQRGQSELLWP